MSPPPPSPRPPQAKGQFKKQSVATGVEIAVPVPSDADSPRFKASAGTARYVPERNVVIWTIKSFPVSAPPPASPWRCPHVPPSPHLHGPTSPCPHIPLPPT